MRTSKGASTPLIMRARQIEEEAKGRLLRAEEDMKAGVEAFVSDPRDWREYLRTLADHPRRPPEDIVELTGYRLSLGLPRMPRIMTVDELAAKGRLPREGSEGITLAAERAMGPASGKTVFYAAEDTVAAEGSFPGKIDPRDRRVDTGDPSAMDAFVAAAGKCDLDSLTPQAEYAISVCYGLDFEDDPVPPPPPASTPAELYDALDRIGKSVEEVQRKIDKSLASPARGRREVLRGARPPREDRKADAPRRDGKVIAREDAEKIVGPKAPTKEELCAMSAGDVARAVRKGAKGRKP